MGTVFRLCLLQSSYIPRIVRFAKMSILLNGDEEDEEEGEDDEEEGEDDDEEEY